MYAASEEQGPNSVCLLANKCMNELHALITVEFPCLGAVRLEQFKVLGNDSANE